MMTRAGAPAGPTTVVVLVVALLGFALAARAEPLPAACIVGLTGALIVPVGWSHHFVYLIPAAVMLALAGRRWSAFLAAAIGVVALGRGPRLGAELLERGLTGGMVLESSLGLVATGAIVGLAALPRQAPPLPPGHPGAVPVDHLLDGLQDAQQVPTVVDSGRSAHSVQ